MLNLKVIGAGAAGNKAAIALAQHGFNVNDITLFNSTAKDVAEPFKKDAIIFGNSTNTLGGCGKERSIGKKLILEDLKSGTINLDGLCDPDTNAVVIVSSTEGGSGSAITPIIAKYLKEVVGIPVIICAFFGFNTDVRGMQNSIEFCQELSDDYGVIGIANSKFLTESKGNVIGAESLANEYFCYIVETLTGKNIKPGSNNIDDTDLYKLVTTPGYMVIDTAIVNKVKNIDQYNKIIEETIDSCHLLDATEKGAKRIGIVYDLASEDDVVDVSATTIQSEYGIPYELYTHIQVTQSPSTVTWIIAGMPLPIREVEEIYDNYMKSTTSVNKTKDSFFDSVLEMQGKAEDAMFNMLSPGTKKETKSKSNFFADFGMADKPKPTKPTAKVVTTIGEDK